MVSIFKAVRQNDVEVIRYLVNFASGTPIPATVPKEDQQWLSQYLKSTGQKVYNLNRRSIRGRTALHCAVAWNRVEIAQILIECTFVNVNAQDRESGWTALHSALYMGNIEIALMLTRRDDIDYTVKDWDGYRPLELLNATMKDTYPTIASLEAEEKATITEDERTPQKKTRIHKGGTDLYSWGINTNYVLGHPDSENRTYPERVPLSLESQRDPYIMKRRNYVIQEVHMSKYHMAIITSERVHNLLVCGFGRGGRLGTGNKSDTQLTLVPVSWSERFVTVALGRDHTVGVTESGSVVTFGSNKYSQLGYETENGKDDSFQLVPRKIQAVSLKKQFIIGTAASRIHSVVHTSTDIFTFGRNEGQLGYHHSGDDIHQITPRKVAFLSEILQVVATENSTAILFSSHEVIVLSNFGQQKIAFPTTRFPPNIQVYAYLNSFIHKLFAGDGDQLGAILSSGDVFLWSTESVGRQDDAGNTRQKKKSITAYINPPKRIWTLTKSHLAARDASIGQNGEVILCTESGNIFIGTPSKDSKDGNYRFVLVPYLQRCIQVCANSSGAFIALRSEYIPSSPAVEASTLVEDLGLALPHLHISRSLQRAPSDTQVCDGLSTAMGTGIRDQPKSNPAKLTSEENMRDLVVSAWESVEKLAKIDDTLDVIFTVQGKRLYCHSTVLCSRSSIFKQLVDGDIKDSRLLIIKKAKHTEVDLKHCHLEAFLLLLDYLYTDNYSHPMNAFYTPPLLCHRQEPSISPISLQKDLLMLARMFALPALYDSVQSSFSHKPQPTLITDLEQLYVEPKCADVELLLKDGRLFCHEVVIRQRCRFFENLFSPGSIWVEERRKVTRRSNTPAFIEVSMKHIHKETMDIVLRYLYTDHDDVKLFDDIKKETTEEMIHCLLDVLCVAEELLLYRLRSLCELALTRFVTFRTAVPLLEWADMYLAEQLKDVCLSFIGTNLSTYILSGAFMHKKPLIHDLEVYIRKQQTKETPFVRQSKSWAQDLDMPPNNEDEEFSTSLYTLSREDKPIVTKYAEQLVTLYPKQRKNYNANTAGHIYNDNINLSPEKPPDKVQYGNAKNVINDDQGYVIVKDQTTAIVDFGKLSQKEVPLAGWTSSSYASKKISQKERRKLQQQEVANITAAAATPKPIWGKPAASDGAESVRVTEPLHLEKDGGPVSSLHMQPSASDEDYKGKKIYVAKSFFDDQNAIQRHKNNDQIVDVFDPLRSIGSTFAMTPIRRSSKYGMTGAAATSPKGSKVQSFQTIQQQQEFEDNWIKGKRHKKNLVQIQTEEKAIEGLSEYYLQTIETGSGEWFEVGRIERFA
ncbi:hypothetical protein DFQ29_003864 [Apophysomyces sp. BC1021]|nr:hypothetical protein DFQ29_003864 [Apophysomyces sp. BC1021]